MSDILVEHVAVQEQQRGQSLVLCACGHVALDGKVGQELFDFRSAHGVGVANAVKANEPLRPVDVGALGRQSQVLDTCLMANLIEKLHGSTRDYLTGDE